jgi:hypothetical protein
MKGVEADEQIGEVWQILEFQRLHSQKTNVTLSSTIATSTTIIIYQFGHRFGLQ